MSHTASQVTTYRMQQCFTVLPNIDKSISVTVSLLYSVGIKTNNYCHCYCNYCYYVYYRGCWHMYIDTTPGSVPSRASSSSCLLAEGQTLPYLTGLNWFAILHRFVQFRLLLRQMQLGNSHNLLHMFISSCKAVSSAVAPHIHWITSYSSTSMHNPLSLGLETTGTLDRKGPRWQPCTGHMHQKESSQLNWPAPCLVQTTVLVHVDGTYIGQVIITYDNQKSERAYWFHRNSR